MTNHDPIEIIKGAILLEKRGRALYKHFAETAENKGVKDLFEMMADEEKLHIEVLSKHMKALHETGEIADIPLDSKPADFTCDIATADIVSQVAGAGNEAAAISAAIAMEKNAAEFYREGAEKSVKKNEKDLYNWLANWEEMHMKFLADIDEELTEQVWTDNDFWPLF